MNNYLMFGKRLRCKVLTETIPPSILRGPRLIRRVPMRNRPLYEKAKESNKQLTDEADEKSKVCLLTTIFFLLKDIIVL